MARFERVVEGSNPSGTTNYTIHLFSGYIHKYTIVLMAVYLFKYNPGGTAEAGATQLKTLQYSTGNVNVSTGGWYPGVDDTGVYVITSDTTTTGLAGRTTGGGTGVAGSGLPTFWRTAGTSEAQLLAVVNRLPGSPGNLTTTAGATGFLNSNNYGLLNSTSGVTFSQLFTTGTNPGTTIENAWTTFRGQLTGSYTNFTFTSSLSGSTAYNVTDATKVQTLATALKNGGIASVNIGGMQWLVGCCACRQGGTTPNAVEFSNVASCSGSSTASLRPWIGNANWGGIGNTVGAATQTLTLTFS
jgi:hypothetical protein